MIQPAPHNAYVKYETTTADDTLSPCPRQNYANDSCVLIKTMLGLNLLFKISLRHLNPSEFIKFISVAMGDFDPLADTQNGEFAVFEHWKARIEKANQVRVLGLRLHMMLTFVAR